MVHRLSIIVEAIDLPLSITTTEKRLYSNNEMILVYASLVTVSFISTLTMLLHVFMLDTVEFKCITKDEILSRDRQSVKFCAVKTSFT